MKTKQVGMTLIELTVVLLILVALAGLAIPYVSGVSSASLCKATDISMDNIKKTIMNGFYMDTLGHFPKKTKAGSDFNLTYLIDNTGSEFTAFSPSTGLGWHGPYITTGIKLSTITSTFKDSGGASSHVHDDLTISHYAPFDGWGNPIIIQKNTTNGFRLISAGRNGDIDTKISDDLSSGDDRVVYLNKPAPETNKSCDE